MVPMSSTVTCTTMERPMVCSPSTQIQKNLESTVLLQEMCSHFQMSELPIAFCSVVYIHNVHIHCVCVYRQPMFNLAIGLQCLTT